MADRRSSVLCAIELSSCWISSRGAPIGPGKPFWLATDLESAVVCAVGLGIRKGQVPAAKNGGQSRAPGAGRMAVLLLEKPTISLRAAIPTARLHARRLAQPAIGQAGRYRRPVEALFAGGDTNLLFATAAHRCRKSRRGREQGASSRNHNQRRDAAQEPCIERIDPLRHADVLGTRPADRNSRVALLAPAACD